MVPALKKPAAAVKTLKAVLPADRKRASTLRAVGQPSACKALTDGISVVSDVVMPAVGFGTYKLKKGEAKGPVFKALKLGYRLIDTAQVYDNETDVGAAIQESGVPREEIFIETKHWRSSHGYDRTMKAFNQSLRKLRTDYVDLYIIHWPGAKTGWPLPSGQISPPDWTPAMRNDGTWRAMEDLHLAGKIRAIGVSNYSVRHLKELLASCRVRPAVLQAEFHPRLVQSELLDFCKQEGIAFQAYASLGSGDVKDPQLKEDFFLMPPVVAAAKAHNVSSAQVLLRWALDKGCLVVPKSSREERMVENAGVLSFKLTAAQVASIDALHSGKRFAWKGKDPDTIE